MMGDSTRIVVGRDGTMKRVRDYIDTEYRPLNEIDGLPESAIKTVTDFFSLGKQIDDNAEAAAFLQQEANRIEEMVRRHRIDLRFNISQALPPEQHNLFGRTDLKLQGDDSGPITVVCPGYDDGGFQIDETIGRSLLTEQNELDHLDIQVDGMREHAEELEREARSLPDLLELKRILVLEAMQNHFESAFGDDNNVLDLGIGMTPEGEIEAAITRHRHEETDDVPEAERNLFKAIFKLEESRGRKLKLFDGLRKFLGMGPKMPEITEQPAAETPAEEQPTT
ncbi:hypothetical protein KKC06_03420 [Patescibacteria group bacterium]|nr:hypothetical protein [Patescibacteria group bacterium]